MSSDDSTSEARVLRMWGIVNRHFESLLAKAERSATVNRAEINIQAQVKELRDLTRACSRRLKGIEAYISELQKQEAAAVNNNNNNNCSLQRTLLRSSQLAGEWHFLYKEDNSVFDYMRLVPETVSITGERRGGSPSVKRAYFTVPSTVLREAEEALDDAHHNSARLNRHSRVEYVPCPCCERSFKASEFWKHALLEIAERGNRVPAWQSLDQLRLEHAYLQTQKSGNHGITGPRVLLCAIQAYRKTQEMCQFKGRPRSADATGVPPPHKKSKPPRGSHAVSLDPEPRELRDEEEDKRGCRTPPCVHKNFIRGTQTRMKSRRDVKRAMDTVYNMRSRRVRSDPVSRYQGDSGERPLSPSHLTTSRGHRPQRATAAEDIPSHVQPSALTAAAPNRESASTSWSPPGDSAIPFASAAVETPTTIPSKETSSTIRIRCSPLQSLPPEPQQNVVPQPKASPCKTPKGLGCSLM
ncbi:hypothetical protein D5F01_LYC13330 [Larimichthys crocea]|uniref:Uncharacterized protein n=1 Tax=Larimichthys crocea TaxID=215358 RepID=A0A6G0I7T8_LARCR|nr:hypothetical protein D5F01_LYC13330 [Larimichthys crocea]